MRAVHLARAADFLHCDLHWLCTGDGGEYVSARGVGELTWLARQVAAMVDEMTPEDRDRFIVIAWQIQRGRWPTFDDERTRTAK
jgi:hypothetical protein